MNSESTKKPLNTINTIKIHRRNRGGEEEGVERDEGGRRRKVIVIVYCGGGCSWGGGGGRCLWAACLVRSMWGINSRIFSTGRGLVGREEITWKSVTWREVYP